MISKKTPKIRKRFYFSYKEAKVDVDQYMQIHLDLIEQLEQELSRTRKFFFIPMISIMITTIIIIGYFISNIFVIETGEISYGSAIIAALLSLCLTMQIRSMLKDYNIL